MKQNETQLHGWTVLQQNKTIHNNKYKKEEETRANTR